jgi:hypothetical protein
MNHETLTRILDLARWAPSGDNTQPWRFAVIDDGHIRVYGNDTRDHIVYDFDGRASHLAHGALLETIRIAATGFGLHCDWQITSDDQDRTPIYDVWFFVNTSISKSPLFDYIKRRVVQRRPMKTRPLTHAQRTAFLTVAGSDVQVQFFDDWPARWAVAKLLWKSAEIRLTCKEAFSVHKEIIEWGAQFSEDRIPAQAVGVDPATERLMEWAMASWERVRFMNRFLGGTIAPRIQLDLLPAMCCAAHMLVRPKQKPTQLDDWIRLGATWQRIWLTASAHGLHMQPEMTPVIFRWYARNGQRFSEDPELSVKAGELSTEFELLAGAKIDDPFGFFCRVGNSVEPTSRSIRKPLGALMY